MLGILSTQLSVLPMVSHRFFGRVGGTSPHPWTGLNTSFQVRDAPARVEENLARVRFQIGVGRRSLFTVQQVHGAQIHRVTAADRVEDVAAAEVDALFTTEASIALGVRTADCAPILMATTDGACVAAIHAGWRGLAAGIVRMTLAALTDAGFPPASWVAAIGPCIGPDAFEVGPEVVQALLHSLGDPGADAESHRNALHQQGLFRHGDGDRCHVDLGLWAKQALLQAGIVTVDALQICTASAPETWYSHRAEAGRTGRQIAVIARTQPPHIDEKTFS